MIKNEDALRSLCFQKKKEIENQKLLRYGTTVVRYRTIILKYGKGCFCAVPGTVQLYWYRKALSPIRSRNASQERYCGQAL